MPVAKVSKKAEEVIVEARPSFNRPTNTYVSKRPTYNSYGGGSNGADIEPISG